MAWHFYEIERSLSRAPVGCIDGAERPRRAEVKALTGLRGVAALLVALYHVNPNLIAPTAAGRFVGKGYLWVDLFFVLGGLPAVPATGRGRALRPAARGAGGGRGGGRGPRRHRHPHHARRRLSQRPARRL